MNVLNKPIDMAAQHNKDGSIRPIRFRVEGEDGEDIVIKIQRLKHIYDEKLITKEIMRKFICVIELNGISRACELGFNLSTLKWFLIKM